jgi:hypothetical protein
MRIRMIANLPVTFPSQVVLMVKGEKKQYMIGFTILKYCLLLYWSLSESAIQNFPPHKIFHTDFTPKF